MSKNANIIAYQGEPGANSDIASRDVYPDYTPMACPTFEDAFASVKRGDAALAMIPVENSVFGRVADIHHLMPESGLNIVAEHFLPIEYKLMGLKGTKLGDLKRVKSHVQALGQCRKSLRDMGLVAIAAADTAGAAHEVAEAGDPETGALAPALAAEIYGLDILKDRMEDAGHNTTRFLIMAKDPDDAEPDDGPCITSFIFHVRNVPAALFKGLGGFATNGVNMTKLESYQLEGSFSASQFYADIEGHPQHVPVRRALEELEFFSRKVKVLGVYPAHPYRKNWEARNNS